MASESSVKILELTRVLPVHPNSPNSAIPDVSLPLTFFDIFWLKFLPVQRLFFYQLTESSSSPDSFNSVVLPNLKHSLSVALHHYLPLAGSLTWLPFDPKPTIRYSSNDGVSVTVAESNADFTYLSDDVIHSVSDFRPLVPELFTSDDKAEIIAIQITFFPFQGFSVGIAAHHAILDGKSSTMFMKAWAYLCKQVNDHKDNPFSLPEELAPVFDRDVIKDPTGIHMIFLTNWLDLTASGPDPTRPSLKGLSNVASDVSESVRATFELKREDIKKLRDRVSKNKVDEELKSLHLSTFVLTYAYVTVCLVKAQGTKEEEDRDIALLFSVDCRSRLDPPIPLNYIGTCVRTLITVAKSRDLTVENGFVFVVKKLSDAIKRLENGVSDGLEEMLVNFMGFLKQLRASQSVAVSGSHRFNVYGSDFGWGKPKKVENVSIDRKGRTFALAESRDGSGGVEIGVVLEKKVMEVFSSLFANGLRD